MLGDATLLLRRYPHADQAILELIEIIDEPAKAERRIEFDTWLRREMRSASADEVRVLYEAAARQCLTASAANERCDLLVRVDHLRKAFEDSAVLAESAHGADLTTSTVLALVRGCNPALRQHLEAVGSLCATIAARLGFSMQEIKRCEVAGRLHDIGLLSCQRSDEATEEEHVRVGWTMLDDVPALRSFADIVLHHHERLDGTGFPYGLAGDQIDLETRVVSVASDFHSLARSTLGPKDALASIVRERGRWYDPGVVDAARDVLERRVA